MNLRDENYIYPIRSLYGMVRNFTYGKRHLHTHTHTHVRANDFVDTLGRFW